MKLIKYILMTLILFSLMCCGQDARYVSLENVEKMFPNSRIEMINSPRVFVVKEPNGNMWYVETDSLSQKVSFKKRIFQN